MQTAAQPAPVMRDILDELEGYFGGLAGITAGTSAYQAPSATPPPVSAPQTAPPAATASAAPEAIRASRIFAGPTQYPPPDFAAYGILAFPSLATTSDRARHIIICEAYVATLPASSDLPLPRSEQMATVWPVRTDTLGERLTQTPSDGDCAAAVDEYDQLHALRQIRLAERSGGSLGEGRGPFLLAWSPGVAHGAADAHVLRLDLSSVDTDQQAKRLLRRWVREIEERPELWHDGWSLEGLRHILQTWADEVGPQIIGFN